MMYPYISHLITPNQFALMVVKKVTEVQVYIVVAVVANSSESKEGQRCVPI